MFEFDQDFALGWLRYSHKTQQTHNRATKEVGIKKLRIARDFWTEECRAANVS
jgi:hypothetical protein